MDEDPVKRKDIAGLEVRVTSLESAQAATAIAFTAVNGRIDNVALRIDSVKDTVGNFAVQQATNHQENRQAIADQNLEIKSVKKTLDGDGTEDNPGMKIKLDRLIILIRTAVSFMKGLGGIITLILAILTAWFAYLELHGKAQAEVKPAAISQSQNADFHRLQGPPPPTN